MEFFFHLFLVYFVTFIRPSLSASVLKNLRFSRDDSDDILINYDGDDDHENYADDDDFQMLIAGGYRPFKHTYTKYVVSVRTSKPTAYFGDNHFCTGTIIASRVILTAAHCVVDPNKVITRPRRLTVVAGAPNRLKLTKTTKQLTLDRVTPHSKFKRRGSYDIALLQVKGQFPDNNDAIKILTMAHSPPPEGTICTVLGWGQIFKNGPYSAEAVYVNLTIYSNQACKKFYPDVLEGSIICAGDSLDWEKDACRGDSGSPLICDDKLVGISSWGMRCGDIGFPSAFTSVVYHRDWIKAYNAACRLRGERGVILSYIVVVVVLIVASF